MATELVERMRSVLDAEEALYFEMRGVLQREQACLASLDAGGIEEAIRAKEALADEARLLEESRLAVVDELSAALGLASRPTLLELCERLGDADAAGGLQEAHSRLVALIGAVRELLDLNAAFVGDALDQVQATLGLLGRLVPLGGAYGRNGPDDAQPVGRLVRRSA